MPSKLAKVQKHVTKKKGAKATALHENSRDARRLRKAGARDDKISKQHSVREKANRLWLERVAFLSDNLPDTLHPMEMPAVQALAEDYLARNDEEIQQLRSERRPARPPATRLTVLEQQKKVEAKEYETGFWVPNLADEETLIKLDKWDGSWIGLANMRFVRIDAAGKVHESQFPPRGAA